jgi:hypothetical protein
VPVTTDGTTAVVKQDRWQVKWDLQPGTSLPSSREDGATDLSHFSLRRVDLSGHA